MGHAPESLGGPGPWPLDEALARLLSAAGVEELSLAHGRPVLVVDLSRGSTLDPDVVTAARNTVRELPVVTVAVTDAALPPLLRPLADTFDVVLSAVPVDRPWLVSVDPRRAVAEVVSAVERSPQASLALAQLMRLGMTGDPWSGLVVESLTYSALQAGPEHGRWLKSRPPPVDRGRAADEPAVRVERDGTTTTLVLDRPEVHNAFGVAMRDALVEALQAIVARAGDGPVVLTGAGPSFCSGGDLREFGRAPDPVTAHVVRTTRSPARLLAGLSGRVRADVHGACVGAGIELAAFARRVVAREGSFFQLPEVAMGLVPGAGGTVSIPRRIGRHRTAWLALTGERIDATTAAAWGLVDDVVE